MLLLQLRFDALYRFTAGPLTRFMPSSLMPCSLHRLWLNNRVGSPLLVAAGSSPLALGSDRLFFCPRLPDRSPPACLFLPLPYLFRWLPRSAHTDFTTGTVPDSLVALVWHAPYRVPTVAEPRNTGLPVLVPDPTFTLPATRAPATLYWFRIDSTLAL